MNAATTKTAQLDGLRLAYRDLGDGPPVLLLHGWPTSSFLWREVMRPIARANRVVALDLPGFGASDKPVGIRYSFDFFGRTLDLFLAHLGIDQLGLVVHDLGGPVGLHWALNRPGRLTKLALLNTLVYPEFSEAVKEFVRACATPGLREQITSPAGLESILRDGLADPAKLSPEVLAAVQEPFRTPETRRALADAGIGVSRKGFVQIARRLPALRIPVRVVYGSRDRVLPDVAATMARVKADLPQADVTTLPDCGHFLQEDAPEEVGALLARFFAP
ncbi:MAG TPA: alpha/beta fold hydrolase [Methylomirabilota bacterium]|nr:alpha/beta fold hydrolase [Methylomirabilota bacterium]